MNTGTKKITEIHSETNNIQPLFSDLKQVPLYIRKPTKDDVIDMERIYENDLEYMKDYINEAFHIDWEKMQQYAFYKYLIRLHCRIVCYPAFFQLLLTTLISSELILIQNLAYRLSKDTMIPKERRIKLAEETGIFMDLSKKLTINRPLIGFLLWQHKSSKNKDIIA